MGITRRLERKARDVARRTLDTTDSSGQDGPRAAYARVLDGRHLWFALPVDLGAPVLVDATSGDVVATADTPSEPDGVHRSARWVVDEVLAVRDGAELLLAADLEGRIRGVMPPHPVADSGLRTPLTPDGRWRLVLAEDVDGLLTLRRESQAAGALLVEVIAPENEITLRLLLPPTDGTRADLVLLDKDGLVADELGPLGPPDPDGVRSGVLTVDRIPSRLKQRRLAVATPEGVRVVTRHPDDVRIPDANGLLMPHLVDGPDDEVLARLAWTQAGFLQLKPPGRTRSAR